MLKFSKPLIETEELDRVLDNPQLRILDCSVIMQEKQGGGYEFLSGEKAWQEQHIPGSHYMDVRLRLSDPDHAVENMMPAPDKMMSVMQEVGIGEGSAVVLYDRGNHAWAARVWWMLKVCGFENAAVLNGGFRKWLKEERPVTTEVTEYPHVEPFKCSPGIGLMVTMQEVYNAIDDPDTVIIHSLPPPTFTGEVVPYKRPGRIPGSCNIYCEAVLEPESGTYPDLNKIREKFEASGALTAKKTIVYCGGGVAASGNALALTCLGLDNVAVYDGSLAEWSACEEMPMETGAVDS